MYQVVVSASNKHGWSDQSELFTFSTRDTGDLVIQHHHLSSKHLPFQITHSSNPGASLVSNTQGLTSSYSRENAKKPIKHIFRFPFWRLKGGMWRLVEPSAADMHVFGIFLMQTNQHQNVDCKSLLHWSRGGVDIWMNCNLDVF